MLHISEAIRDMEQTINTEASDWINAYEGRLLAVSLNTKPKTVLSITTVLQTAKCNIYADV